MQLTLKETESRLLQSQRKDERQFTTLSCTNKIFTRCDDFPEDGLNAEDKAANAEARWVGPP